MGFEPLTEHLKIPISFRNTYNFDFKVLTVWTPVQKPIRNIEYTFYDCLAWNYNIISMFPPQAILLSDLIFENKRQEKKEKGFSISSSNRF